MYSNWFKEYKAKLNKLEVERGTRFALSYNKLVRLAVTRFLSGEPLPKNTPGINLTKDGLPTFIYYLHLKLRLRDRDDLKIIFTMLNLTRGVVLKPVDDFKTITDSWKGCNPPKWASLQSAVKRSLGYRRSRYNFESLHTSTKSGPNGQAMLSSFLDYLVLPDELKEQICKLGGQKIKRIFSLITQTTDSIPTYQHWFTVTEQSTEKATLIRKLSTFGDKEGKTRVIGILDYWSQTVLRPIHKAFERILKNIPEDCTYDQSA